MNLSKQTVQVKRQQTGATLIVCLIILVIITLLGVGSIQDTTLEEKMAGNMKNRNAAFQAAESALRDAENYLANIVTTSDFDGTGGYLSSSDDEPDYYNVSTWSAASSAEAVSLGSAKSNPRYIIKYIVEEDAADNNPAIENYGDQTAGDSVTIFKIIARGTGGADNAVVVLQTFYGKRF